MIPLLHPEEAPAIERANALLGAMRGQIIDSLVCDESLARAVLTNSEAD